MKFNYKSPKVKAHKIIKNKCVVCGVSAMSNHPLETLCCFHANAGWWIDPKGKAHYPHEDICK